MKEKLSKEELHRAYDEWHARSGSGEVKFNRRETKRRYNRMVSKLLKLEPAKKILDVACGNGSLLRLAEEMGLTTFGIDISERAAQMARKIAPNSEILVGIAEELPWEDNYFDYITCWGSLEHFLDPERAIAEMARVLKPDGLCAIKPDNIYFIGFIYMAFRHGVPADAGGQTFSEEPRTRVEWHNLLERNGLNVLRTHKDNTPIWHSKRVNLAVKLFYNLLVLPFIPLNLSEFIFICQKHND